MTHQRAASRKRLDNKKAGKMPFTGPSWMGNSPDLPAGIEKNWRRAGGVRLTVRGGNVSPAHSVGITLVLWSTNVLSTAKTLLKTAKKKLPRPPDPVQTDSIASWDAVFKPLFGMSPTNPAMYEKGIITCSANAET